MHTEPPIKILHSQAQTRLDNTRHTTQRALKHRVDLRLSLVRDIFHLPWRGMAAASHDERSMQEIVQAAKLASRRPGAFLLGGGDPLRRSDLRDILAALAQIRPDGLGLCFSGHGVTKTVVHRLQSSGVQRAIIPFHSARQDAHDWLVGQSGALKVAHRAIRACIEAELPVEADVVLTRSTAPHLAETIEVLAHLGVRRVAVRRLTGLETDGPTFVPLSPRVSSLESSLEDAASVALKRRIRLMLRDLPLCAAPRLRRIFATEGSEAWVMADGSIKTRIEAAAGCITCPGAPQCSGAPDDYVARFGWEEFADPACAVSRVSETVEEQKEPRVSHPMTFAWRGPHRVRCPACSDEKTNAINGQDAYEPTRGIRARLVQAACYRPARLRLVGADLLAHPQAAQLIYDAVRLFPHVEVAGEASAVVDWSDLDMRRVKDLQRIDVALYGPDATTHDAHCGIPGAFAAMQRAIERLRAQTDIPIGSYAILHDARLVPAYDEAWLRGQLPGEPRFRLSGQGSSLDELAACAAALPRGQTRSALVAVLPRCLHNVVSGAGEGREHEDSAQQQTVQGGRSVPYKPSGSDPAGAFETCQTGTSACVAPGCPGIAIGWHTARSKAWTMSI